MKTIEELRRLPSPAPRPQALAFDGTHLWMGSVGTGRLYAIDPIHWTVRDEVQAPGHPWGMTVVGDELRVVCGFGENDDRYICRFIPGHGFKEHERVACPEFTGSQLGYDGERLFVSQFYNQRVLALDAKGSVLRTIDVPRDICGQTIVDGCIYLLTTEDEKKPEYLLTRIDARDATPKVEDIARVPFHARALSFDGSRFWTSHREAHEIVAFADPR
ncbi:MAG TPA: hypothetical protein VMV73_01305 [Candidatus Dormibacteraeota bacterium]|nr:hypothetical protein [Candidatus Dormibacteraeota bacterium]